MLGVRQKFQENNFPVDVMWNDLDYMVDYQDFTLQKDYLPSEMNKLTDLSDE
jgi:alpha-glucosidase (family GH31 glycosyl hydrolase)